MVNSSSNSPAGNLSEPRGASWRSRGFSRRGIALGACLTVGITLGVAFACSSAGEEADEIVEPGDPELRREILTGIANDVYLPALETFLEKAEALEEATAKYAASLTEDDRAAAQAAWTNAMSTWQMIEVMQVGPLAPMALGGDDLRDKIYSWPLTNPCRVDMVLVEGRHQDLAALRAALVNEKGLDALEYLIFVEGTTNDCPATNVINSEGSWDALGPSAVTQGRADYAAAASQLLVEDARAARDAFSADGGNFVAELIDAGSGSTRYSSSQDAFNDVSGALLYVDTETKDMKVAVPAGLMGCTDEVCPDDVESPFSFTSKDHIAQNLAGLELVYFGGPPDGADPGFDDLLVNLGQEELAAEVATRIDEAQAAVAAIKGTLTEALATDPQQVRDAFEAIKRLTDLLKTQFSSVLALETPDHGASDTD